MKAGARSPSPLAIAGVTAAAIGSTCAICQMVMAFQYLTHDPECGESHLKASGTAFSHPEPVEDDLLSPSGMGMRGSCPFGSTVWFDEDKGPVVRGDGPRNGAQANAWLSLTRGDQVFVGKLSVDLWSGTLPGDGPMLFPHFYTEATHLRLVERLAPPRPGPPGWRVIQPGQCVLASADFQDDSGVVGRFLIDLPEEKTIDIHLTKGNGSYYFPLDDTLSLDGDEVPVVPIGYDTVAYHTERDGRYELVIRRTDTPDAGRGTGAQYSVIVTWGLRWRTACSVPSKESSCLPEFGL